MKVCDLVIYEKKLHVCIKERVHVFSLQEIGCTWPPMIIGKANLEDMKKYKTVTLSKIRLAEFDWLNR